MSATLQDQAHGHRGVSVRVDLASALDGLANDRWRHAQEADQLGHPDWGAVFGRAAEILHELATELRRAVGT